MVMVSRLTLRNCASYSMIWLSQKESFNGTAPLPIETFPMRFALSMSSLCLPRLIKDTKSSLAVSSSKPLLVEYLLLHPITESCQS